MPTMPASLEALQNKTKMVNTKKIKHKDEIITFSESDYNRLLSLPVEERRAVVERGYDYVKNQKLQKQKKQEINQRSTEAKKVLSRFDTYVPAAATPSGSYLDMATRAESIKPGLGEGPKEPYIAAALKIPEQDLDTTSGLPAGIRAKVSLLVDREARRVFLEKQTGGTLESLNINGATEDYIRFPNGKVVQVDETGFGAKDFSDMSGEILPTAAEITTAVGLTALSAPTAGGSTILAGAASPAAGALVREFQSIFAQEVLGFAPEVEVNFLESAARVAGDTIVGGIIETALIVGARPIITTIFPDTKEVNKVANAAAESAADYNKKFDAEIKQGKLSAVPVIPITKEGLEFTAVAQPKTMIRSIQKTQDNLNSVPEVIFGGPEVAEEFVQRSARREIESIDLATEGISKERESLGSEAVDALTKDLKDRRSTIEFSLTGGTQPIDELAVAAGKNSEAIIGKVDTKISENNTRLFDDVFNNAYNEQVSVPIKTVVEAIQGKTIARKGKKKLDKDSVDAVVSQLFLKVIQKRGKEFKTLGELKADDFYQNGTVTFAELDRLWKTNKEAFNVSATSANEASRSLDKRLNDLRKSSVKNAPQTKASLEKADAFYRDTYDRQRKNIYKQFFENKKGKGANVGLKSLVSSKNSLKSAEDIRFAREQVEKFGDPEDIRLFNQSLRYQILNEKNFIDGVPAALGREEKILFREVFGNNEAEFLFDFAKSARAANVKLTLKNIQEVGNVFLRQGRNAGRKAVDNIMQADRLQKRADDLASEALFSRSNSKEIINGDLNYAGKRITDDVSPESVSAFVSQLNTLEKRAFKKYTLSYLIENQGKMQGETGLFDAKSVLKVLEKNPEKYETIFGGDVDKIKSFLNVFDTYNIDLKRARERNFGQVNYGNRVIYDPATSRLRLYTNLLMSLPNIGAYKAKIGSMVLASAFTSGKFNPKLSKWTLPDLEYNEAYITKLVQTMLIAEDSVDLVLGQDDLLQRSLIEFLGSSNMDRPIAKNQAPLQYMFED
jgi:hypothetical protein